MIPLLLGCLWAAGSLRVCGSETLGRAASAWSGGWNAIAPQHSVETHFPGSRTSLTALAERNCQVALLSRRPAPSQHNEAQRRLQAPILLDQVGWDEVVFFVHLTNPVKSMSLAQLRSALSSPRAQWRIYGRNALSGTHGWVQENVLAGKPFSPGTRELPGPEGVVRAVASDPKGIGYSGRESLHGEVRVLSLTDEQGQPLRLLRPLFLARIQGDAIALRFSQYVLSVEGQTQLGNCGLLPMRSEP
ncbi:MAG: hypothetical protein RL318_503 [Fibrobacterota bacterium]|jgi:phosphate transport system substrate-binding protein